jgi:uncharacterized coiled-coil protein SlyX
MNNNTPDRLDRIEALVESNARAIESLSDDIAANRSDIAATRASIDGLVKTIAEFSIRSEMRLNKLDDAILEIRNTNQNLEQILNYLVRRDSNGSTSG